MIRKFVHHKTATAPNIHAPKHITYILIYYLDYFLGIHSYFVFIFLSFFKWCLYFPAHFGLCDANMLKMHSPMKDKFSKKSNNTKKTQQQIIAIFSGQKNEKIIIKKQLKELCHSPLYPTEMLVSFTRFPNYICKHHHFIIEFECNKFFRNPSKCK